MTERFHAAVSVAILRRGRLLLLRRGPAERSHVGTWEMPGGAVEAGESLAAAARREAREESSLRVALGPAFHAREWTSRRGRFINVYFAARAAGRAVPADGMDGALWARPGDLAGLRMIGPERAAARAAFQAAYRVPTTRPRKKIQNSAAATK